MSEMTFRVVKNYTLNFAGKQRFLVGTVPANDNSVRTRHDVRVVKRGRKYRGKSANRKSSRKPENIFPTYNVFKVFEIRFQLNKILLLLN